MIPSRNACVYVQGQLGHASPAITLTTYTHLIPRHGHRAVDGLDTPPDAHESASLAQADTLTLREIEGWSYPGFVDGARLSHYATTGCRCS